MLSIRIRQIHQSLDERQAVLTMTFQAKETETLSDTTAGRPGKSIPRLVHDHASQCFVRHVARSMSIVVRCDGWAVSPARPTQKHTRKSISRLVRNHASQRLIRHVIRGMDVVVRCDGRAVSPARLSQRHSGPYASLTKVAVATNQPWPTGTLFMDVHVMTIARRSAAEASSVFHFVVVVIETAAPLSVREDLPIRSSVMPATTNNCLLARRLTRSTLTLCLCL